MSLTRELVRLIRNKPIGDSDLRQASLFVLDTVACALGALKMIKAVMNLIDDRPVRSLVMFAEQPASHYGIAQRA